MSLAIVNNVYCAFLTGPTQMTLTTAWPRFKITGTLAGGQTNGDGGRGSSGADG